MAKWFLGMAGPVFLHLFVIEFLAVVFGNVLDASSRVLLASLIVIPPALYMYRNDRKSAGKARDRKTGEKAFGRSSSSLPDLLRGAACCLLCFAAGGLLNLCWSGLLTFFRIQDYFPNTAQESLFAGQLLIQILAMGIFAPLAEELIFRGLLYGRMRSRLPVGQSVILSSLLFALYHGNVIQMVFVFPLALVLALLYEKSGKLFWPVLFHMGSNLTAIAVRCMQVG